MAEERQGALRRWLPLVAICTGTFMLLVDITVLNVALPDMAADLGTTYSQLQWVLDVYALALASLVLGAGSLADLYGRRRIFLGGLVLFALSSLACGLAPTASWLIAARGLQGIGGAAMFATTTALINTSYEGRARGTAFGVWAAVVGAAAAVGPVLGGALTELSWRWIFFVNLPLCLFAVVLTLAVVQEARRPDAPGPDVPGIALFMLGAGAVVFGLIRAAEGGWSRPGAWAAMVAGLAVLGGWVLVERRRRAPMLDLALLRSRSFSGLLLGGLLVNGAAFATTIYTSLWLQSVLGLTPLQAGLVFIPVSLLSFVVAAGGGRFLQTLPPRFVLAAGLAFIGAGSLLLALVHPGAAWSVLVPGLAVVGIGVGGANPTLASAALASAPRERSGMAAGAMNTARQLGFALGVAVLGSVFTARAAGALAERAAPDPGSTAAARWWPGRRAGWCRLRHRRRERRWPTCWVGRTPRRCGACSSPRPAARRWGRCWSCGWCARRRPCPGGQRPGRRPFPKRRGVDRSGGSLAEESGMSDVVLVHGAWHGSWCWRRVLPRLWAAGHRVVPVTLTGLGERAHLLSAEITLGTHVVDVVTAVRTEECRDAVLVGHSYGGMVITGAADQLEEEVGRLVYVDGVVPTSGECWSTRNPPAVQEERRAAIARFGALPPPPASVFGLAGADAAWVDRRQTPQPAGVYDDPVTFDEQRWAARPRTFVDCTTPALPTIDPSRRLVREQPGWEVVELATGHDPMISAPDELAEILLAVAAR